MSKSIKLAQELVELMCNRKGWRPVQRPQESPEVFVACMASRVDIVITATGKGITIHFSPTAPSKGDQSEREYMEVASQVVNEALLKLSKQKFNIEVKTS